MARLAVADREVLLKKDSSSGGTTIRGSRGCPGATNDNGPCVACPPNRNLRTQEPKQSAWWVVLGELLGQEGRCRLIKELPNEDPLTTHGSRYD